MGLFRTLFALASLVALSVPFVISAADPEINPELKADLASVQGRWSREVNTPNGIVTLVKEHAGRQTILTATDANNNILYAHTSEFRVERQGRVRLFVYFNRTTTVGPDAGAVDKKVASYVYRVTGDQFVEAHGLLEGEGDEPRMIVWKKLAVARGEAG